MIVNIEDLRSEARRNLPRAVFDFIDGGSEGEYTLRQNESAFGKLQFRPRVLVDVSAVDQSTTVLGQRIETPVIFSPTGVCGMAAPRGEVLAAKAAVAAGSLFTLPTLSAVTIEDVATEVPGPHWFQLYMFKDRELTKSLIDRVRAAGYRALMLTVDTPVLGQRERDIRNRVTFPFKVTVGNAVDSIAHAGWLWSMARERRVDFANFVDAMKDQGGRIFSVASFVHSQFDPSLSWKDLEWLRAQWSGPLALKGILTGEDAKMAVDAGMECVIVSNHGGRQLDCVPATIEVLPEVVEAVGGRAEVILDGGVRRGSDVVKALALGARAVMIGRPYLYGLAANGQKGAELAVSILRTEIERAMALLGRPTVASLDRTALRFQS